MDMHEALSDWREAQASGQHHEDCDGRMVVHRVEIVRIPYSNGSCSWKAACEECGDLHIGSFGQRENAVSAGAGHAQDVRCDGRCKDWQ